MRVRPLPILSTGAILFFLGGCQRPPAPTVVTGHPYVVATLPPGTRLTPHPVGEWAWKASSNIRVRTFDGVRDYEYTGTGSADSAIATLPVRVTPGFIYSFSAVVDPSHISQGQFDLFIDPPDGSYSYAVVWGGRGPTARFGTAPWRCPPGVTRIMLGMQTVRTTVTKGGTLRFSSPEVMSMNPAPETR